LVFFEYVAESLFDEIVKYLPWFDPIYIFSEKIAYYDCLAKLAFRAATNSLVFFGGTGKSALASITIASDGQPVAQIAHPKHLSRFTCGTSFSLIMSASDGQRPIHVSQVSQRLGSKTG
jgi:hypothetical protein